MNKIFMDEKVRMAGDTLQLKYGKDFSCFTKDIDAEGIKSFCKSFNSRSDVKDSGYLLESVDSKVILKNNATNLAVDVQLLDRSAFINATDRELSKIEDKFFDTIVSAWKAFLSKLYPEYKRIDSMNETYREMQELNQL